MTKPLKQVPDFDAHQILEGHLTNVTGITRKVMQAAIDEYAQLKQQAPPQVGLFTEILGRLQQMDEALELFARAVVAMRATTNEIRGQLETAWQSQPSTDVHAE